jgi:hypothetical protein
MAVQLRLAVASAMSGDPLEEAEFVIRSWRSGRATSHRAHDRYRPIAAARRSPHRCLAHPALAFVALQPAGIGVG